MAQYEASKEEVVEDLGKRGVSASTRQAVEQLVPEGNVNVTVVEDGTVPAGTTVAVVPEGQNISGAAPPVTILENVNPLTTNLTPGEGGSVIVGSSGDNSIFAESDRPVTVETGGGNDFIVTGSGADRIVATGVGNATVRAGDGNDTIVVASDAANVTVDGGDGFDKMVMEGQSRGALNFAVVDGVVVLDGRHVIENVEVVEFEDGISVLADNVDKAVTARLYKVMFDREADLGGLEFWMDSIDGGLGRVDIANAFVFTEEFRSKFGEMTNEQFLAKLYLNMSDRAADADGQQFWLNQLENGQMTRGGVALHFAESAEAVEVMGIDGTQYVIDIA